LFTLVACRLCRADYTRTRPLWQSFEVGFSPIDEKRQIAYRVSIGPIIPLSHPQAPLGLLFAPGSTGEDRLIRVLIVDDQKLVRQAYQALLCGLTDIEVVGEARDGVEAIDLAAQLKPDVVTMDIKMPRTDGLQATQHICQSDDKVCVVMIAGSYEESIVARAFECGAKGYVAKVDMVDELVPSIRSVYQGNVYYSARLRSDLRPGRDLAPI
jgi:CheY-like chemotaxis protein